MRSEKWSTVNEIKRELSSDINQGGGPVLYYKNGHKLVYNGEGHVLTLGVSGAGKSRRYALPMIRSFIEAGESYITIDPKGELWRQTSCFIPSDYEVHCIDFRHVFESEHYNPLSAAYELYHTGDPVLMQVAQEMVDELAMALFQVHEKADPFWPESARSLFCGIVLCLMEYAKPEEVNMASVYKFVARGDERFGGPSGTYLKEYVDLLPEDFVGSMLMKSYVSTASETQAGIRSTFLEGISIYARSQGLVEMLGSDDLHINHLNGEKPLALYVIIPDERSNYDAIAGNLVNQLLSHFIRIAEENENGRLGCRLNVILEELGNVGSAISSLDHLMTASRSRGVRVHMILQALSQLDSIYGSSKASTIRSNADVLLAFRTNHWDTLVELSRKCGQREVFRDGHVIGKDDLITPAQLGSMVCGQGLCIISGRTKFITWLPDYAELFDVSEWKAPTRTTKRNRSVSKMYDIQEHVKRAKKKKMDAIMGENHAQTESWLEKPSDTAVSKPKEVEEEREISAEQLIKMIEARKKKLEEETKKEEETRKAPKRFKVVLVNYGAHYGSVVKTVRDELHIPLKVAAEYVKELPHTFAFDRKVKAQQFKEKLLEAGAKVE